MTNNEFVTTLRQVADLYESKPELPIPYVDSFHAFLHEKEALAQTARVLGSCEKGADENYFYLKKVVGSIQITFNLQRNAACRRVVVGTRTVAEKVIPAHQEEIIEWHCESLLKEGETALLPEENVNELTQATTD